MPGSPRCVWLWEGCLGKGRSRLPDSWWGRALMRDSLATGAASRSPDVGLEGRHGGKVIAWAASAFGRGARGIARSWGLASPAPHSPFSKPAFLPGKVTFLSKGIHEWKTVCPRRAPPTHIRIFPSHSNLGFALITLY